MKLTVDDLEKTYDFCISTGNIKEKSIDIELIKSLKTMAEKGLEFINNKSKDIPKDSLDWTFVFRDYYESLRSLIEAYMLFDGIVAENHQCKNAYLCIRHAELELDWMFLETIRLKRNAMNYRGQLLRYDDWKELKLKFELHISAIKKEIEKKLGIRNNQYNNP
jgi:CRISPR/Cas system-associated protein Cas10 (large subunit of type III CRISPR-Cas system)